VRAGTERNVATGQVDQFRHAKPGLQGEQKKHPISPARSGRQVGCSDESFDLRVGEIIDRPFLVPLGWHGQHLLAVMQELRLIAGDILEERADRRQGVFRLRAPLPRLVSTKVRKSPTRSASISAI
jgi:hypothetical protein